VTPIALRDYDVLLPEREVGRLAKKHSTTEPVELLLDDSNENWPVGEPPTPRTSATSGPLRP
jgi:hypothetical protein